MRPKSVADERRQLALALELSKREIAAGGRRSSRVGTRILYLCFVFTCGLQAEAAILRTSPKLFRRLSVFYSSVVEKLSNVAFCFYHCVKCSSALTSSLYLEIRQRISDILTWLIT